MNYSEFYKQADTINKEESPAPEGPKTWKDNIENVYGYHRQIPMLTLLGLTGALGGYALSNRKKRGAGAAYGAFSLPALYLMYVASRRNKILPPDQKWDDMLDKGSNKVNDWGNQFIPFAKEENA